MTADRGNDRQAPPGEYGLIEPYQADLILKEMPGRVQHQRDGRRQSLHADHVSAIRAGDKQREMNLDPPLAAIARDDACEYRRHDEAESP